MNTNIDKIRAEIKGNKNKLKKVSKKSPSLFSFVSKLLITIIITLGILILLKSNKNFKSNFYKKVYEDNISFATINNWYEKYFGSSIPFNNFIKKKTETVFNEKIKYNSKKKYSDGVELSVDNNYLVPIIESGMVVYIGEKKGYGKTVIIQQMNGIDVWYGNVKNKGVKLYDYVEKGSLLGEVKNNKLYLVFKKDGKALSYEDYI